MPWRHLADRRKALWGRQHYSRLHVSTNNFQIKHLAYRVNSHYSWILAGKFAYLLQFIYNPKINTKGAVVVMRRYAQSSNKLELPNDPVKMDPKVVL